MFKLIFVLALALFIFGSRASLPDSRLAKSVRLKVWPRLQNELHEKGLKPGSALYIRIFKEEDDLEIWVKDSGTYKFFKSYNICFFSGGLGPKTRKGDRKPRHQY